MCSMVLVSVVIIVVETFTNRQHGGMGSLIWLRFVMFGIVGYVRGYCWCAHHLLMSLLVGPWGPLRMSMEGPRESKRGS